MYVYIDDNCIGCGRCEDNYPDIFELGYDNYAKLINDELDDVFKEDIQRASQICPVNAISFESEF